MNLQDFENAHKKALEQLKLDEDIRKKKASSQFKRTKQRLARLEAIEQINDYQSVTKPRHKAIKSIVENVITVNFKPKRKNSTPTSNGSGPNTA